MQAMHKASEPRCTYATKDYQTQPLSPITNVIAKFAPSKMLISALRRYARQDCMLARLQEPPTQPQRKVAAKQKE